MEHTPSESSAEGAVGVVLKLSLLENAYDSLNESLANVGLSKSSPGQWKFAVLNLVHALELFLKQRLYNEHRLLLFDNVDRPGKTVSLERALERLKTVDVMIDSADIAAIQTAIKWRNSITHYETDMHLGEVRNNYLLIFEFLDGFHFTHFGDGLTAHLTSLNAPTAAQMIQEFRTEFIEFQGREMHRSWPIKLLSAQDFPVVRKNGIYYDRIPWGQESHWPDTLKEGFVPKEYCHDCACSIGQLHGPGCDTEQCPLCKGQFTYCECELESDGLWELMGPVDSDTLEAIEALEQSDMRGAVEQE
jgi:hypothetical protein